MKHQTKQRAVELAIADVVLGDGGFEVEFEDDDGGVILHSCGIDRDQLERIAESVLDAIARWERQHKQAEDDNVRGNIRGAENAELQPATVNSAAIGR